MASADPTPDELDLDALGETEGEDDAETALVVAQNRAEDGAEDPVTTLVLPEVPTGALGRPLEHSLREDPVTNYLARIGKNSRKTMRNALYRIARLGGFNDPRAVPWASWTNAEMALLRAHLAEHCKSPNTANLMLTAAKQVIRACFRLRLISADERDRTCDVEPIRGSRVRRGKLLTVANIDAMLQQTGDDARGVRDRALLGLIYGVGLRIHEPSLLTLAMWEPGDRILIVRGKGNKEREVSLGGGTLAHFEAWLKLRGSYPGPIFVHIRKATNPARDAARLARGETAEDLHRRRFCFDRPLSESSTAKIVRRLAAGAGVAMSTHDLRRSFISTMLMQGTDALLLARIVGHSDPRTTLKYDMRGRQAITTALDGFYVPVPTARRKSA